jgi:iron complex transport system ATP-binding protein
MSDAMLHVEGLGFAIEGRPILRDVGFEVQRGEYLAVVGPNGAGKTTLLKCLDRLLTADRGTISLLGRPLGSYRQRDLARQVGYVPQADGRLLPFTVEEFVTLGRYPHLSPFSAISREDRRAVREALEQTGMLGFAARRIDTLSGGERQKAMIAAALAQGAALLLLDEPTTFLDYRHQAEIRELLRRAHRDGGATIVAVTHDVNAAALESDRVLALRDGAVVFHGPPRELMQAERLATIFATPLQLVDHPRGGLPMIVPGYGMSKDEGAMSNEARLTE